MRKIKEKRKEKNTNKLNIKKYFTEHKFLVSLYLVAYLIATFLSFFITLQYAKFLALLSTFEIKDAIIMLVYILLTTLATQTCWSLVELSSFIFYKHTVSKFMWNLAEQALKLDSTTYANHDTGTFIQRIISEPNEFIGNIENLVDYLSAIVTALATFIYISTINIYVTLIMTLVVIIGIVLERIRTKIRKKNLKIQRKSSDKINSLTTEMIKSQKDIKSLNLESELSKVSRENYFNHSKNIFKTNLSNGIIRRARTIFVLISVVLVLMLSTNLYDSSTITLAAFMIIYSSTERSIWELIYCSGNIGDVFTNMKVSYERMNELYNNVDYVEEKFGKKSIEKVKGKIEFKNVTYSYIEYEEKDENEKSKKTNKKDKKNSKLERKIKSKNTVLENLSFKIQPNKTVAFVGKSGSGKTTILDLISKMYQVDSGEVLIDDINVNELDKPSLRSAVSYINQFPYIFDMTIKENLLLAKPDATEEDIENALEMSAFKEFVDGLPNKIDTKVGESGIKLSGGQRQRLAIARAILRKTPIIIFDESTSSLDNFAQQEIKHSIDKMKGSSTIIIVAHRLSTIKDADEIFFLENGKIIDSGDFNKLYKNNKTFKTMFMAETENL